MREQDFNTIFSNNLNHYLNENCKTQAELAKYVGVSTASVSNWCKGIKLPRMDKVDKMCDFFQIKRSDLMDEHSYTKSTSNKKAVIINVLGRVAAGIPIEAVEEIIDQEEITEELARTGSFFGLQIKGNSMEPRICEGDVVIVRQQDDAESGDVVIALINGDDAVCKRLRKYRDGIELISNNPSYEPMYFDNDDIEKKPVRIIGKVVELRGKF